ncbi:WhiB family transcriptional regulator [Streptomyces sp. NPDC047049]|uniref:WhiB family transcriptional regulator n=1 Tax=Streptomyces sp. NPDC047049 TaxID=3156688 RepID=UPI0033C0E99A
MTQQVLDRVSVEDAVPCRTTDPEVFHRKEHEAVAKSLCHSCELLAACRSYARDKREWGTWGAETSAERSEAGFSPAYWAC